MAVLSRCVWLTKGFPDIQGLSPVWRAIAHPIPEMFPTVGPAQLEETHAADVILSIREWAALVGIGYSSARKMLREGNGPKKTALSMHRIGIAISSHKEWIRERTG